MGPLAIARRGIASVSSAAKVVVVGGSGFVGSAICQAAVARGASVFSVSRSGKPAAKQLAASPWAAKVTWLQGDALEASEWPETYLEGAAGIVSCVGSFGSHDFMRRVCGEANVSPPPVFRFTPPTHSTVA